ncbi:hypothetical protein QRX50_17560 [Amycolatopsis carbonis]|uniref:Uncharacterized protein n=1 Tax=Amycolatopsis carbonis TaxID=715471 RepID=A0A9Y2IND9_9PSEU|nr:hypothetical protein [Amycolatopsis sp. 2-15]WIX82441.1 hypothetical protein QRX50_17560 [Amycolatopsis sp. 2-15]
MSEAVSGVSLWSSKIFHNVPAAADPFLARARLRRVLGSEAVAAAFAELFTGKAADF